MEIPVRIAIYGNTANALVPIAQALRNDGRFDAHLYVDDRASLTMRPESDPSYSAEAERWIHRGHWYSLPSLLLPRWSRLRRELDRYDLTVVADVGPVWSGASRVPTIFVTTGADLTVRPFPLRCSSMQRGLRRKLFAFPIAYWQRRGIRRADSIWTQPFAPFERALARLGIPAKHVSSWWLRIAIDLEAFDAPEASDLDLDESDWRTGDFVVFHPSRLTMNPSETAKQAGQWKGTEVLIRGFARFAREESGQRRVLALIDSELSGDVAAARELISDLGISGSVIWLRPPRPSGFERREMKSLYARADVVADDFGAGWFGMVTLEGLAMGRPVLAHVDNRAMGLLYESNPICEARSEQEIASRLSELISSTDFRERLGREGRHWVEAEHAAPVVAARYVAALDNILTRILHGDHHQHPASARSPSVTARSRLRTRIRNRGL